MSSAEVPPIDDGEFLVKNEWMSVDPYMRGRMKDGDSYVAPFQIDQPLEGGCIGKVVESRNEKFTEGEYVLGKLGWREYWKTSGEGVSRSECSQSLRRNRVRIQRCNGGSRFQEFADL